MLLVFFLRWSASLQLTLRTQCLESQSKSSLLRGFIAQETNSQLLICSIHLSFSSDISPKIKIDTYVDSTVFSEIWLQVSWQIWDIIENSFWNLNTGFDSGLFFLRRNILEVKGFSRKSSFLNWDIQHWNLQMKITIKWKDFYPKQENYLNIMHDYNLHTGCL